MGWLFVKKKKCYQEENGSTAPSFIMHTSFTAALPTLPSTSRDFKRRAGIGCVSPHSRMKVSFDAGC